MGASHRTTAGPRSARRKFKHDGDHTATDGFCGAGGSSSGLKAAGFRIVLAANHWERAIETHSANFPDTEHLCADISQYDLRRWPRTTIAWFSPICTELSPAGGNVIDDGQLDMLQEFGHVPKAALERTRTTFHDVIRATEVHRYQAVIVENVVEAARWVLFEWWLNGMKTLGYNVQIVCVSSAHVGDDDNPHAPQWRDRMYMVFTRKGIPLPDVEPRPLAWCARCGANVGARQAWKNPSSRRIGKYRSQYVYVCPNSGCGDVVEPWVRPAAAAIDWSDLGQRIGDRKRPLAPATVRRIRAGLELFSYDEPVMTTVTHGRDDDGRWYPASGAPLPPRTTKIGDGVACPPFYVKNYGNADEAKYRACSIDDPLGSVTVHDSHSLVAPPFVVPNRTHNLPRGVDDALPPLTTGTNLGLAVPYVTTLQAHDGPVPVDEGPLGAVRTARHHALTVPPGAFIQKHHGGLGYGPIGHMTKDAASDAMPGVVARPNLSLVIPYRRAKAKTTGEPMHTMTTHDSAALVQPAIDVDDCMFRMLKPREHLRAQRFRDDYIVHGNLGEQTMQAGNAVSSNVAQWLGAAVKAVL